MATESLPGEVIRTSHAIKIAAQANRKPSILMILHLPPPVHGAAVMGKYIKDSKLINDAFDIDYINLSTSDTLKDIGRSGFRKLKTSLRIASRVIKQMFSKKYDLCYMTLTASDRGFYKDLVVVTLLKLAGKKIIYHFHNRGVATRQSKFIDNLLYKFAFRNTKSILVSTALYADIEKYVKRQDTFVCPNGISVAQANRLTTNRKSKPADTCQLLFLSHIMIEKGVITLLEACRELKIRGCRFTFHFVGSWMNITEAAFHDMVNEMGLDNMVIAHGPKFNQEKIEFFEKADILVLPSYNETFGLVLLEAMSFNLPIVATNVGGIPDVVVNDKTGFLVQERNSMELADKLEVLIHDEQLRLKFGNAGAERFHSHFTIGQFEKNIAKILKTAIDEK